VTDTRYQRNRYIFAFRFEHHCEFVCVKYV
jgi:hypothetical protein